MEYPLLHEQRNLSYYTMLGLGLARLWSLGNTLLGAVGALGGRWTWHEAGGIIEVSGGWLIGLLARRGWASAITLGEVVLYADCALMPLLHDHEMVHIYQGRRWGPFFLPVYILESAYQQLRTGDGYRSNRFEVAAYRVSKPNT